MDGERGSIVDLDGIAKKRPYCMVAGDIEAVVEVGILILRRDIGMEKEGLFCFSFSGILYTTIFLLAIMILSMFAKTTPSTFLSL